MPKLSAFFLLCALLVATPVYANQDPANMDAVKTPDPAAVFKSGRAAPATRALPREPMLGLPQGPATLPQMPVAGLPGMPATPAESIAPPAANAPGAGAQIGIGAGQDAMQLLQQQLMPGQTRTQMDQIYPRADGR